jgi:hypothetical protein
MDEVTIPGRDDADRTVKQFMTTYDAPAFVRRGRQVQAAFEDLLGRCRAQREGWLAMVRLRLGTLHALAGDWGRLAPLLADASQVEALQNLHAELQPRLRAPVRPALTRGALRGALRELRGSIERFNERWRRYLLGVDVRHVNALREDYNRYYVLEKECALRSPRLARLGFRPLPPVSVAELEAALPPLPVPQWQG